MHPRARTRHLVTMTVASIALLLGCADEDPVAEVSQTIRISADEFDFTSDVVPEITAGETVRFIVTNDGRLIHEMQVLDSTGRVLGRTADLGPGESEELVVTFEEAIPHQVICDIDDHLSLGQRAIFLVEPA